MTLKLHIILFLSLKHCLYDIVFLLLCFVQPQLQCSPGPKLEMPDASSILYSASISLNSIWSAFSRLWQSRQDSRGMKMREKPSVPCSGVRPGQLRVWVLPKWHIRKETNFCPWRQLCWDYKRIAEIFYWTIFSTKSSLHPLIKIHFGIHFPLFDERMEILNIFHLVVCCLGLGFFTKVYLGVWKIFWKIFNLIFFSESKSKGDVAN